MRFIRFRHKTEWAGLTLKALSVSEKLFLLAHKKNAVKKFIAKVTQTGVLVQTHFRLCLVFDRLFNSKMVQEESVQINYMYLG